MKLFVVVSLLLVLAGCESFNHSAKCLPADKEGYQWCHNVIEYWDQTQCVGSCDKNGGLR